MSLRGQYGKRAKIGHFNAKKIAQIKNSRHFKLGTV